MKIAKIFSLSIAILSLNISSLLAKPLENPVSSTKYQLTGSLLLLDSRLGFSKEDGCYGSLGYRDLHSKSSVIIFDEQQNIIAKGSVNDTDFVNGYTCLFSFSVSNIPKANFYTIQIGNRKTVLSFDELVEIEWKIELFLGGS